MSGNIAIASDHAGFQLKSQLIEELNNLGYSVVDLGTEDKASTDYPDYGFAMAQAIKDGKADRGVLICGTGIGISIAANRYPWIRAGVCSSPTDARLTRQHNDANVLAMGERLIGDEVAKECLRVFLETEFDGGERHARRVNKLGNPPG